MQTYAHSGLNKSLRALGLTYLHAYAERKQNKKIHDIHIPGDHKDKDKVCDLSLRHLYIIMVM